MARTFKRNRQMTPLSELNVTNLIDLAFTLLIIFMITAPLIQQEQTIPINLPVESKSTQVQPDKDTRYVSLSIDAQGTFYYANDAVALPQLQARLRELSRDADKTVVRIRADGQVPYQQVVLLMDELKKNELKRITFDTQTR